MRYRIRVRRINQVFTEGSEYDAKVARVAVLYEDLRLENIAASETSIVRLDESGKNLRQFYFIRRSIATVREFAEALAMLDADPDFERVRHHFDASASAIWTKSIRFFRRWDRHLRDIRNDFGGHFGYSPALFAINHLHDGAVSFEYAADPARQTGNVRFNSPTGLRLGATGRVRDLAE